jgi:glutaredoxin-related protein
MVFIVVGVICKMVLESDYTYWYMHSLWHVFLGVGLTFSLPKKINTQDKSVYEHDMMVFKENVLNSCSKHKTVAELDLSEINIDDINSMNNAANRSTYVSMRDSESETDDIFKIK